MSGDGGPSRCLPSRSPALLWLASMSVTVRVASGCLLFMCEKRKTVRANIVHMQPASYGSFPAMWRAWQPFFFALLSDGNASRLWSRSTSILAPQVGRSSGAALIPGERSRERNQLAEFGPLPELPTHPRHTRAPKPPVAFLHMPGRWGICAPAPRGRPTPAYPAARVPVSRCMIAGLPHRPLGPLWLP